MSRYSEKLRSPKWQVKRLMIMNRDLFACRWCGDTEEPQAVHHTEYIGSEPWETPNEYLITLCQSCHCDVHTDGLREEKKIKQTEEQIMAYQILGTEYSKEKSMYVDKYLCGEMHR